MNAPTPRLDTIRYYIKKWHNNETTQKGENFLKKLFLETYPNNTNFDEILIKVCSLNCIYSTNLPQDYLVVVAEHILRNKDVDKRLKSRDVTLVNDLSYIQVADGKVQSFYSFITKYCGHHVKAQKVGDLNYSSDKEFPAFDGIAEEMIKDYNFKDHFTEDFEKADLKDYAKYVDIMNKMRKHYKLEEFTFKELDIYLNQCGRSELKRQKNNKKFPRKANPRKYEQDSTVTGKTSNKKKPRHKHSGKGAYAKPKPQSSSSQGRPSSGRPSSGRPSSGRPAGGKPAGNRPTRNRPQGR